MKMDINRSAYGRVFEVRRVDGYWSKWVGLGNAEGLTVSLLDGVEHADEAAEVGEMSLADYIRWSAEQ